MAAGDIWRIAFEGALANQLTVNIWHVKFKSVGASIAGAVTYLDTNLYQLLKTYQATSQVGYTVHAVQLASAPPVYDTTITATGTVVTELLPPQIAMIASLRTGIAGRSYRGRLYLPGFTEATASGGGVDVVAKAAIQGYFDDLVAAIGSGGSDTDYEWGVWSPKLGGASPPYNLSAGWHAITEVIVRGNWGVQRRRGVGFGA